MALFERCGGQIETSTTDDSDLHLVLHGTRLNAAGTDGGVYSFALDAPPADALYLRSRSGVPSLTGITAHDHRRLGVAISRIEIIEPGVTTILGHEAPALVDGGCYSTETGYSWTDGELALPTRLFAHLDGPFTLTVHIERPGMRYPLPASMTRAA
jgi:hypothetical protein